MTCHNSHGDCQGKQGKVKDNPTEKREITVAIAVQPNTGKFTVFNRITGMPQRVGNWPGKTVDRKEGHVERGDRIYNMIDLRGCYMGNNNNSNSLFTRMARFILTWRWPLLLVTLLLTIFFFYEMRGLRFDNSNEIWFVEGDRSLERINKFKDTFGNDDFVYLVVETEAFFQPETIRLMGRLSHDLEANVPYLRDTTWLGNVKYIEGVEGGVKINELIETIPENPEEMAEIRRKALNEPTYVKNLISPDGKAAGIILEMERYPEDQVDPGKKVAPAVRKILEKPEYQALKPYLVGGPVLHHDYSRLAASESRLFLVICLGIQMAILMWVRRGIRDVVIPPVVVILGVFWTMGMIGVMGYVLNLFVILIPVLLICVGIGDSMHVITEFHDQCDRGFKRREAMVKAMAVVGLPCFLTSLTTAAGFLSFLSARIKPFREMGVYATTGVVAAFLITVILVPIFYSFGKEKAAKTASEGLTVRRDVFDRFFEMVHVIVVGYPKTVVSVFAGLFVFSVIGYQFIEVESSTVKMLSKKLPLRQAIDFVDERMGGSMSMEIMLDTGKTDGVKDPAFLKKMDALQDFVDKHPLVTKTMSVLDVLKKMRRAMHNNDQEFYSVPDRLEAASQYLFMYETSGGDQLDKLVGFDYDIARLTVKTRSLDTRDVRKFTRDVTDFTRKIFDPEVKVELTGRLDWVRAMNDLVAQGQMRSFTVALIIITLIMVMVLRSVKLGFISMVPNVFTVFITLGLMGFAGMYMDLALMSFSAVIIGVAVDDTIHFFIRYRREFERLGNYASALQATLSTVGRPICFTTMTLTLGFLVLMLSDLSGFVRFGILAGFAFFWALLADFFLAPAMMLLFKPLGPEKVENVTA